MITRDAAGPVPVADPSVALGELLAAVAAVLTSGGGARDRARLEAACIGLCSARPLPGSMPLPFSDHWSEAWAAEWCGWFERALTSEEYPGNGAPVTLLVALNSMIERGEVEVVAYCDDQPATGKGADRYSLRPATFAEGDSISVDLDLDGHPGGTDDTPHVTVFLRATTEGVAQ